MNTLGIVTLSTETDAGLWKRVSWYCVHTDTREGIIVVQESEEFKLADRRTVVRR